MSKNIKLAANANVFVNIPVIEKSGEIISITATSVLIKSKKPRSSKFQNFVIPKSQIIALTGEAGSVGTVVYKSSTASTYEFSIFGTITEVEGGFFKVVDGDGEITLISSEFVEIIEDIESEKAAPSKGGKKAAKPTKSKKKSQDWDEDAEEDEDEE